MAVSEIFFPWGNRPCHQICLYYTVTLIDETQIPLEGVFSATDELDNTTVDVDFYWVTLAELKDILLYPPDIKEYILNVPEHIVHFIYTEKQLA